MLRIKVLKQQKLCITFLYVYNATHVPDNAGIIYDHYHRLASGVHAQWSHISEVERMTFMSPFIQ